MNFLNNTVRIIRKFLVTALFLVTINPYTLTAMETYKPLQEVFTSADGDTEADIKKYITDLINKLEIETLQQTLDILSQYATPLSIEAHNTLFDYINNLGINHIKGIFTKISSESTSESTFKVALRLIYTQKSLYNPYIQILNLDDLDCAYFIKNVTNGWVNYGNTFWNYEKSDFLSETFLKFTLPLLEQLINNKVTSLNLSYRDINTLPYSIGNLIHLTDLYLAGNKLSNIPSTLCHCAKLQDLDLSQNNLPSIPLVISTLVNLTSLRLSSNNITTIDHIFGLKKLEKLFLDRNEISEIPGKINSLGNLKYLNLNNNAIMQIHLEDIRLLNNKLTKDTEEKPQKHFGSKIDF